MPVATTGPVLLVTPRWTRDGGVGSHAMASAGALVRHGIEVHALAARVDSSDPVAGVTVHQRSDLYSNDVSPELKLGEALEIDPTVIHLHQFDDPELLALMRRKAPVVSSVHGYTACTSGVYYFRPGQECKRSHGPGCIPNLLARGCAHTRDPRSLPAAYRRASAGVQALRAADLTISYSSSVDRHLAANGVSRREVIPLFTTMVPRTGEGHAQRRRVVFAGRVVAPKGVAVLLRAAREVQGEFVVCGDGWRLQAMRRLAERLRVEERVSFRGWLGAEELARELAEASLVVVPSIWPEPFGLVGIEALAAGRPVVASATGGIVDWLQDGVNGLAVAPGSPRALAGALNELLADPARQQTMGAAGKRMVAARFTPERHVSALLQAYGTARATWRAGRSGEDRAAAVAAGAPTDAAPLQPAPSP